MTSVAHVIDWDIPLAEKALGYLPDVLMRRLCNGTTVSKMMAPYLESHGFKPVSDKASGELWHVDGLIFRLRVAVKKLDLAPSKCTGSGRHYTDAAMREELSKIDGWLIVFTASMPNAPIYAMHKDELKRLRDLDLLNTEQKGPSIPIHRLFKADNGT